MGYPRKSLICLEDTPYYHVVARCVRRAWLWGCDAYAGKDYSHRKAWMLQRLRSLAEIFSIDLCAYAIMSNHYHLVLRVDRRDILDTHHAICTSLGHPGHPPCHLCLRPCSSNF